MGLGSAQADVRSAKDDHDRCLHWRRLAEIAGCFAFWAWLRLDKSAMWVIPGTISLALFAYFSPWLRAMLQVGLRSLRRGLHRCIRSLALAGRRTGPGSMGSPGAAVCVVGAAIILFAPRAA